MIRIFNVIYQWYDGTHIPLGNTIRTSSNHPNFIRRSDRTALGRNPQNQIPKWRTTSRSSQREKLSFGLLWRSFISWRTQRFQSGSSKRVNQREVDQWRIGGVVFWAGERGDLKIGWSVCGCVGGSVVFELWWKTMEGSCFGVCFIIQL